jgi:hypothetical protein
MFKYVIWLTLLFCLHSRGQTIYGVRGLIKIPSAYIADNGKCIAGMGYFKDYYTQNEVLSQWSVYLNIGFHSKLDISIRIVSIPGTQPDSRLYNNSFDRIFNGKFVLFKEKKRIPQITLGLQDIIGTRLHNSTYLVLTKTLQINKSFSLLLNSGYGSKKEFIWGEDNNNHFIGFFGGTEIGFKKIGYLVAEYDSKDVNAGLRLMMKSWFNLSFSMLQLKYPSPGISVKFTI